MSNQNPAAAAAASAVRRPPAWAAPVAVLAVGTFAMGTDSFVLAGILPQLAAGFRISTGAAGQVVTAFALTYALAAPILATTTGHLPRKGLLLAGLGIFIVANLAATIAPNFAVLLLTRMLAACGAALFTPTASAAAAVLAGPARRGLALSMILGGLTVGTVFGVPAGTAIGQHLGWQASMVFIAAVGVAALLALLSTLRPLPNPPPVPLSQRLGLIADRRIASTVAVSAISVIGGILVYTYIAEILAETAHLTGAGLAMVLLVWGIGGSIGTFGSGWFTDRLGPNLTIGLALTALVLSLLALGFARNPVLAAVLMAIYSGAGWGVTSPSNAKLVALAPALPGVAISLNSSATYLGQAMGAMLGGLLLSFGAGGPLLCVAGAAFALLSLGLHLGTMRAPATGAGGIRGG